MIKKILIVFIILITQHGKAQLVNSSYTISTSSPAFTALVTPTVIYVAATNSVATNSMIALPFSFSYGCVPVFSVVISPDGWLSFNPSYTTVTTPSISTLNDLDNSSANFPNANIVAPLWDNLSSTATGSVSYAVSGAGPNRILKIEYKNALYNATFATLSAMSFQVWLYETTNVIEFRYVNTTTNPSNASASVGLMGNTTGDFISLSPITSCTAAADNPTAVSSSTIIENSTIPCRFGNRMYKFTPNTCSTPTAGIGVASPSVSCTDFTTNLSLSGNSGGCGVTYQWFHCNTAGGTYTAIASASSTPQQTFAVTSASQKFFKCDVVCSGTTATTPTITALVGAGGAGLGSFSVTPTYSVASTTCNYGNEIYATGTGSVINVCGNSVNYAGADVVYVFTPTSTLSVYNATLTTPTGLDMVMNLYKGCPTSTAGICIASNSVASASSSMALIPSSGTLCPTSGGIDVSSSNTYYLVIDAAGTSTSCSQYTLNANTSVSTNTYACNLSTYATSTITPSTGVVAGGLGTIMSATTDNTLTLINIPFSFCFDGRPYNQILISDNSTIVFPGVACTPNLTSTSGGASSYASATGNPTGSLISMPAPVNNTSVPRNAILAPWHDLKITSVTLPSRIQYTVAGTIPTQTATITWTNNPMVGCVNSTSLNCSRIILYEGSNNIEIHVGNKKVCTASNNGQAIMGLHNYDGSIYVGPVNSTLHNTNVAGTYTWTEAAKAYRFSPTCSTSSACTLAALPINFKSFDGDKIDNINTIFWSTSMEENMDYFVIERSLDAQYFEEIAIIEAKNKSSDYIYKDYTCDNTTINYYRLRAVEEDLKYTYTKIISIGTQNGVVLTVWPIYPNPTNTVFNIPIDARKEGNATIVVTDIFGHSILKQENNLKLGPNLFNLGVEHFEKGVYYIEIQNTINQVVTKQKLVIN